MWTLSSPYLIFDVGMKQNIILGYGFIPLQLAQSNHMQGRRVFLAPFLLPIGWIRILYYWLGSWQKETLFSLIKYSEGVPRIFENQPFLAYSIGIFCIHQYGCDSKDKPIKWNNIYEYVTSYPQNLTKKNYYFLFTSCCEYVFIQTRAYLSHFI